MESGIFILLITFILTSMALAFVPYLTRKTENFGVSIPEEMFDRKDFRNMRKTYTMILLVLGALFCLAMIWGYLFLSENVLYIISTVLIFVFIIASFLIYLPFHFKMKRLKAAESWQQQQPQSIVIDTKFRDEKLTLSNWGFLVPGLITVATIAITFIFYEKIPDQIPMHTDFAGNVRYDEKTLTNLLFLPGTQIFLLLLFIFINFIIKQSKQQVSVNNPNRSKQQNIMFRRRWSGYLIGVATLMSLLFLYIQWTFIYPKLEQYMDVVIILFTVIIIAGTIVLAVFTGQGGSRIKLDSGTKQNAIDRDDDQYWKLGIFYVNRQDPSLFIEKRFGVGWTNNWAHPLSWVFIIAIVAIPIILTIIFM
jgi:uncharacterized membrane protein